MLVVSFQVTIILVVVILVAMVKVALLDGLVSIYYEITTHQIVRTRRMKSKTYIRLKEWLKSSNFSQEEKRDRRLVPVWAWPARIKGKRLRADTKRLKMIQCWENEHQKALSDAYYEGIKFVSILIGFLIVTQSIFLCFIEQLSEDHTVPQLRLASGVAAVYVGAIIYGVFRLVLGVLKLVHRFFLKLMEIATALICPYVDNYIKASFLVFKLVMDIMKTALWFFRKLKRVAACLIHSSGSAHTLVSVLIVSLCTILL